jgi:hypothetical protein
LIQPRRRFRRLCQQEPTRVLIAAKEKCRN